MENKQTLIKINCKEGYMKLNGAVFVFALTLLFMLMRRRAAKNIRERR
jgi:hypothetical protein